MTGSRYKSSNEPIFTDPPVRNPRRIIRTGGGLGSGDQSWGFGGEVGPAVDAEGTPWYPPGAVTLTKFIVAIVDDDPSQSNTAYLLVDGVVESTLVLGAGSNSAAADISIEVTDFNQVRTRLAANPTGTGRNLSMIVRYEA